jgi:hypothetical protein
MNEVYQQPATGVLESFGTKACETCAGYAETASKLLHNGDRFTADRHNSFSIHGFGENSPTDPRYTVSAQMKQVGAKIENVASGRIVQTDVRENVWLAVYLVWADDGWRIDGIQFVDDGLGDP